MEAKKQVFRAIEKTFKKKDMLKLTVTSILVPIFKLSNKRLDQAYRTAEKGRFASTHYVNTYIMKEENEFIGCY